MTQNLKEKIEKIIKKSEMYSGFLSSWREDFYTEEDCLREVSKKTEDMVKSILSLIEADRRELVEACQALIAFQEEYKKNTLGDIFPGNDFYADKGIKIVEMARKATADILNKEMAE